MIIIEHIKKKLEAIPEGVVFSLQDFGVDSQFEMTLVKALSRFVAQGVLHKVAKGRYYKPRRTMFGILKPTAAEIAKDFLEKDGLVVGYISGPSAFTAMGLTTQISSSIVIGSNKYRRPLVRDGYSISFLLQTNAITQTNISLLRILDAIRLVREIPAVTPDESVTRIGLIIANLTETERQQLCVLSEAYSPYVRALLGAILEQRNFFTYGLKSTLKGVTNYKLPISETALPTKRNWSIL